MFGKPRSASVSTKARSNSVEGNLPARPADNPAPTEEAIAALAKGKKAALSSCSLDLVPPGLLAGQDLTEIILDYNRLRTVPLALFQLSALKKLSLQHNYISVLPDSHVIECGKKLGTVELAGNPLAFPPITIAQRGWSTVKKWVPANPNYVTYRLYYKEAAGAVHYTDFNISTVRDTMVKTKDEDRDMTYFKCVDHEEVQKMSVINRHKMDKSSKAVQKDPGWTSAPNATGKHLYVLDHLYISVFDGHCGVWVAQALTTNLYKKLAEAKVFDSSEKIEYEPVIRKVFMDLDKVICEKLLAEKWNDGSTCVTVTFKSSGEMIAAHVGDSRASAKIGKKDVELTKDHDPGQSKEEKARVEARGGKVDFVKGCWRINANLSVSRAFGDTNMKTGTTPIVDADPDVLVQPINPEMDWLIVASDGLWHLMDNPDVIKMAAKYNTAEEAALALMSEIDGNTRSQLKGHDNTTITAVHMVHGAVPAEFREKASL